MSLLTIYHSNPEVADRWKIDQVISAAGEGKLLDNSDCQLEFREFLSYQSLEKINEYVDQILSKSMDDGGLALQDLVNEVGRRLGFDVVDGLYRGRKGKNGFDGLWQGAEGDLIIEVKTSDTYRVNINTIANYAKTALQEIDSVADIPLILIVVGRQDTGELEAQIRGGKHAWSARIIGVNALIRGALVLAKIDGEESSSRFRRSLFPIEYTRVDELVELFFSAVQDKGQFEPDTVSIQAYDSSSAGTNIIEQGRRKIVDRLSSKYGEHFKPISKARFVSVSGNRRLCVGMSRRYDRPDQNYWYALTESWLQFLRKAKDGSVALGFEGSEIYCEISLTQIEDCLPKFNQTNKDRGKYWHLAVVEKDNGHSLLLPKSSKLLYLNTESYLNR